MEAAWALLDSCSSVHAVNMYKHMPGAKIRRVPRGAKCVQTAGVKAIPDREPAITSMKTEEGIHVQLAWEHTDVSMLILSIQLMAKNEAELRYREHDGTIHHTVSGEETTVIA